MIKEKETIIKLLSVIFPKSKIYLFGSRARGDYKVTSDLDLAIDTGNIISSLDLAKAQNIIDALNIPQKVDIVDFNAAPQALKDNILKDSVIWKN